MPFIVHPLRKGHKLSDIISIDIKLHQVSISASDAIRLFLKNGGPGELNRISAVFLTLLSKNDVLVRLKSLSC